MKCVFVSDYLSPHQLPFCDELYNRLGNDFVFVSYAPMAEHRKKLHWVENNSVYEIKAFETEEKYNLAKELLLEADVAILGGQPNKFISANKRLRAGKLTFRFSERLFKKKHDKKKILRIIKHIYKNFGFKKLYLLSASAYAATDYAKIGLFKDKAFSWGYFPATKKYNDVNLLFREKTVSSILWVGRYVNWKHPEIPVLVAEKLRDAGYHFNINMIGTGDLEDEIQKLVEEKNLSNYVHILGSMAPQEVRVNMEKSKIFLFTSDRGEGWGAVLNEAMNSGCVPIASHAIGSAPYLIEDGVNGFLYKDGDIEDLYNKIKFLLEDDGKCKEMGSKAYFTVTEQWCAENAAERFLKLSKKLLTTGENSTLYEKGVLSKSLIFDDNWYL